VREREATALAGGTKGPAAGRGFDYFTVRLRGSLWLRVAEPEPVLPVTVKVYVPVGVPGFLGPPPPPPPPHPAQKATLSMATARGTQVRRQAKRRPPIRLTPAAATSANIHNQIQGPPGGFGLKRAAEGAVVLTDTVIDVPDPLKGMGEGLTKSWTVSVKLCVTSLFIPLLAVIAMGKGPEVVGVLLNKPLALNGTPLGSPPVSPNVVAG
jgi:hypothetical protein